MNDKIHFGFFKDESGVARRDLGVDGGKSVDGVKLVVWSDGERKVYGELLYVGEERERRKNGVEADRIH